jgi:DNA-directed RNA polymerase subunit N (RpoN/RPB10)
MAKESCITIKDLKNELQAFSKEELIVLVTEIAKSCSQARNFLTIKFSCQNNIREVFESYKQRVKNEFFPKRGHGRLDLQVAKKAVSDFTKICKDKKLIIDIMLFYVENCVKFTRTYGDIHENFYISAENMFDKVIKILNVENKDIYEQFATRIDWILNKSPQGWGFQDTLRDIHCDLRWADDED